MKLGARPRARRPIRGPLLASVLYVAAVTWAPIVHSQTEVLRSAQTVESGHSDQCAVLHVETACGFSGLVQIQGTTARDLNLANGAAGKIVPRSASALTAGSGVSLAHPARAPPSR